MPPLALTLLLAADPFAAFLDGGPALTDVGPERRGSAALAVGPGLVARRSDDGLMTEHVVYENHRRRALRVTYTGVRPGVVAGARLEGGETLGLTDGRLAVRYALDGAPTTRRALSARPLFDPRAEAVLVLIDHETYALRLYRRGVEVRRHRVGFGQAEGVKAVQGDLKTPKGMYFVTGKHRGAFGGPYGDYYGGHWIKVSYPNPWDADRGLADGVITRAQARAIEDKWARRALPLQGTRLGGGIGLHGWIGPWDDDDPHLTWGCVVMHNEDIAAMYDEVPVGAMVVIF